jgi:hypothetical protein
MFKEKLQYSEWKLKNQILIGVTLPLIVIQLVFCICLLNFVSIVAQNA